MVVEWQRPVAADEPGEDTSPFVLVWGDPYGLVAVLVETVSVGQEHKKGHSKKIGGTKRIDNYNSDGGCLDSGLPIYGRHGMRAC